MNPVIIVGAVVLIVFVFYFLRYLFTDPYVLQNIQDAKSTSTISSDELSSSSSTGSSSTNFSYSIWIYVNDWNYKYGEPKVIFGRMGGPTSSVDGTSSIIPGINGSEPCPLVFLDPYVNNVSCILTCYAPINEETTNIDNNSVPIQPTIQSICNIVNVPIQSWVNLIYSISNRTTDVYLNGKLVRTCLLPGTIKVSDTSNVFITPKGGFDGYTAKFAYYPYSLNPQDVWNIYKQGYSSWSSFFNSYQIQFSMLQNGIPQTTLTI